MHMMPGLFLDYSTKPRLRAKPPLYGVQSSLTLQILFNLCHHHPVKQEFPPTPGKFNNVPEATQSHSPSVAEERSEQANWLLVRCVSMSPAPPPRILSTPQETLPFAAQLTEFRPLLPAPKPPSPALPDLQPPSLLHAWVWDTHISMLTGQGSGAMSGPEQPSHSTASPQRLQTQKLITDS